MVAAEGYFVLTYWSALVDCSEGRLWMREMLRGWSLMWQTLKWWKVLERTRT